MENENEIFSTRDLWLASALVALDFFVVNINFQIEGAKRRPVGYFEFEKTPELEEAEKKFWTRQLLIEPKALVESMKSLKSRVVNTENNPMGINV